MFKKIKLILIFIILFVSCNKPESLNTIDLSKDWKFSPDKNNMGTAKKWYRVDFDDSKWKAIDAGKRWEDQGYPELDGNAWYRKTVEIPSDWKGKDVWIKFGAVNDAYDLYVNGKLVSSYGASKYSLADKPTFSEVNELLNYGETNQITIKVVDWGNSGGLWRLPVIITTDKSETELFKPLTTKKFIPEKEGYALYWEDNFNGDKLDKTKWKNRALGERRNGYGTPDAVEVKDGFLNIKAYVEKDTFKIGAVSTEGIKGFKYGYFECRAKLPETNGPWAAFWIQSPKISQGEDPAKYGVEIDIFEYFKNQGGNFLSHCLHWAYGPHQKTSGAFLSKVEGLGEGFHTFALEWTPEKYAFFVDGIKYHEYKEAISHIEENIILSYEPCGKEAFIPEELPDTFKIDYVRVYKK